MVLSTIFALVRQFAIPNPFETLGEGLIIKLGELSLLLPPELLNILAEPIVYIITFSVVGLYYRSGSEPALGCFLYMLFYVIHIGVLYLLLIIYPIVWLIILICVGYIVFHILIVILKNDVYF